MANPTCKRLPPLFTSQIFITFFGHGNRHIYKSKHENRITMHLLKHVFFFMSMKCILILINFNIDINNDENLKKKRKHKKK